MRSSFDKLIIFLALSVNAISSVYCQNGAETDSHQSYDLVKSIQKSLDHISASENLKRLSEEDIKLLNGIPNFVLPLPFGRMLRDVLSESESSKCAQDLDYVFAKIFTPGGWSMKSKHVIIIIISIQ
ncbi:hypothetical protein AVEN_75440-1 [Araneus ventricosus]|uniref:Uncharacterized protein n=1 Tax=Araneus ventricosus TaxID=182803 RepID=A0A4Y2KD06_ARAVE|nr:hypothetical protein AVEN_75440-1 [Araneus ventricosus]